MHDGTVMTVLQDTIDIDVFKQVGGDIRFHDDLVVYDRCGQLFQHFCTEGPMGSCKQMQTTNAPEASLLDTEGYSNLRASILEAARSSSSTCHCDTAAVRTSTADPRLAERGYGSIFVITLLAGTIMLTYLCWFRFYNKKLKPQSAMPQPDTYGCPE